MSDPVRILLISGSLRAASTNSALMRTAAAVAPDGIETEIYELPAAWVNAAAAARGENADESLRKVLGYVGADIAEEACVRITIPHGAGGADGVIDDPKLRERIGSVLISLAAHVRAAATTPSD